MTTRRTLLVSLMTLAGLSHGNGEAQDNPRIPPTQYWDWDIRKKDSTFIHDFTWGCNSTGVQISFVFHHNKETDIKRLLKFLGSGASAYFTKDPVHPQKILPSPQDPGLVEAMRLWREGVYARKHMEPGVIVPIRVTVENISQGGQPATVVDETVQTEALAGGGNGMLYRDIMMSPRLLVGAYRLRLVTLSDNDVPPDARTGLSVGPFWDSRCSS